MPEGYTKEDKGILETIGRLLQNYQSGKKKKQGGLESKIGQIENLTKIDTRQMLLDIALKGEKIQNRTDEGALMRLRSEGVGNWGMGKDY